MPWSPWQTADLLDVAALVAGIEWHFDHGVYDENIVSTTMGNPSLYCLRQYGTTTSSGDSGTTRARQYSAPADWASQRDWNPALLGTLRRGIDYGVRPDRTGSEQDAYVEYDAGDNVHVAWDTGRFALDSIDPQHASAFTFDLGIAPNTVYAAPSAPTPIPSVGTVFASGDQSTAAHTVFAGPPDPTPAKSFTVSVEIPASSIVQADPAFMPQPTISGTYITPTMKVQPPRWRYWIPQEPPLRQRQRDDGLGLSGSPRWRGGSSRQSSNRWRAYL